MTLPTPTPINFPYSLPLPYTAEEFVDAIKQLSVRDAAAMGVERPYEEIAFPVIVKHKYGVCVFPAGWDGISWLSYDPEDKVDGHSRRFDLSVENQFAENSPALLSLCEAIHWRLNAIDEQEVETEEESEEE